MGSSPLVIGLDSSTQSTKAIAWNRAGEAVAEGRADIPMANPQMDFFEQDPTDWWQSTVVALKDCVAQLPEAAVSNIQGMAISNQRETVTHKERK